MTIVTEQSLMFTVAKKKILKTSLKEIKYWLPDNMTY